MESKIYARCNLGEKIEDFYNKYTECNFYSNRSLKRYYENKDKVSNHKIYSMKKNREKLLQKQNDRCVDYKELLTSYVELENKLKMMAEKITINESEIN